MYKEGTILTLKEPQNDAYDRVRVVGRSPISYSETEGNWGGVGKQGIILTPENGFGATVDQPLGKIQQLYDVHSIPEDAPRGPNQYEIERIDLDTLASPEDVFNSVKNVKAPNKTKAASKA